MALSVNHRTAIYTVFFSCLSQNGFRRNRTMFRYENNSPLSETMDFPEQFVGWRCRRGR